MRWLALLIGHGGAASSEATLFCRSCLEVADLSRSAAFIVAGANAPMTVAVIPANIADLSFISRLLFYGVCALCYRINNNARLRSARKGKLVLFALRSQSAEQSRSSPYCLLRRRKVNLPRVKNNNQQRGHYEHIARNFFKRTG